MAKDERAPSHDLRGSWDYLKAADRVTPARKFRDTSNQTWLRRLHAVTLNRVSSERETLLSVHHPSIRQRIPSDMSSGTFD
jgi:hypothetical protein